MSWVQLALALLGLANQLIAWRQRSGALQQAQDTLVAEQALRLLEMTQKGKELRAKIAAMSDAETEDLWNRMASNG